MATLAGVKEELLLVLDELPPESLLEVRQFLEFLRFKSQKCAPAPSVALGAADPQGSFPELDLDYETIEALTRTTWEPKADHLLYTLEKDE